MSPRRLRVLAVLVVLLAGGGWLARRRQVRRASTPAVARLPPRLRLPLGPSVPALPTLVVCVTDGHAPVAAAAVTVARPDQQHEDTSLPLMAQTGADGCMSVEAMRSGRYTVTAAEPGHTGAGQEVTVGDRDVRVALVLGAPAGWLLRGRVVDAGGGPIAGATVGTWSAQPRGAPLQTRADEAGRFSLRVARQQVQLYADADGYARTTELFDAAADAELALKPAAVLAGKVVVKDSGQPVAGAEVLAVDRSSLDGWMTSASVLTDEQGQFTFDRLPPGHYHLVAREGGRVAEPARGWLLGRSTRVSGVTLPLAPACEASGRVLGGGKPVAGATLGRSHSSFLPAVAFVTTDASGLYRLAGLVATDRIEIQAAGFATVQRRAEELCQPNPVDIELAPGVRLEGRVVDGRGGPVPGADVTAVELAHTPGAVGPLGGGYFTRTDDQGRFHLDDLPRNAGMMLVASQDEKGRAELLTDQPGAAPVELRLEDGGATVSGHVRYPDGQPVPGALVRGSSGERDDATTAGAQGEYRLRHLLRGKVFVVANHRGSGPMPVGARGTPQFAEVEIARDNQTIEGVDLVLPRRDGTVRGRVLDHQGKPMPGVGVFVQSGDPVVGAALPSQLSGVGESTTTDPAGNFAIGGLPVGTYAAWAGDADDHESPRVKVTPPSEPITLTLPAPRP